MKTTFWITLLTALIGMVGPALTTHAQEQTPAPAVMLWEPRLALKLRQLALAGDKRVKQALKDVRKEADAALSAGPFSVVDKTYLPPSGDRHDFSTIGRYYWPNPDTADGLPWIRRDGQTNPAYFDGSMGDTERFQAFRTAVNALARAWYVTEHEPYARKASELLRVWFLNPETRMNPNANYAARFPGHWDGKGWGIHGTRHLTELCDAVGLLASAPGWTTADQQGMHDWMAAYLDWVLTSPNGVEEANTTNNHGTAYDWLVVRLAVFVGRPELARKVLEECRTRRIASQFEADGSLPLELARANGWNYVGYALEYHFRVALLGDQLGVDLWHYQAPNGASLRLGLDYLIKHIQPEPGQLDEKLLKQVSVQRMGPLLSIAAAVYHEPAYQQLNEALGYHDVVRINFAGPNPQLCVPGLLEGQALANTKP